MIILKRDNLAISMEKVGETPAFFDMDQKEKIGVADDWKVTINILINGKIRNLTTDLIVYSEKSYGQVWSGEKKLEEKKLRAKERAGMIMPLSYYNFATVVAVLTGQGYDLSMGPNYSSYETELEIEVEKIAADSGYQLIDAIENEFDHMYHNEGRYEKEEVTTHTYLGLPLFVAKKGFKDPNPNSKRKATGDYELHFEEEGHKFHHGWNLQRDSNHPSHRQSHVDGMWPDGYFILPPDTEYFTK